MPADEDRVRLDKWLWAARFYKTRALAAAAVNGGKVHLSGERVKSSRAVKTGDCYQVHRGYERFEVIVLALSARRASASIAQQLYQETERSVEQRVVEAEKRKLAAMQHPESSARPDKKQRRKIRQFREENQS